jgi:hypothetical protein
MLFDNNLQMEMELLHFLHFLPATGVCEASVLSHLTVYVLKRRREDFQDFLRKFMFKLLTGSGKYRILPSLIFSCTNRIAMRQHFNTGFSKRFLIKGIADAKAKNP